MELSYDRTYTFEVTSGACYYPGYQDEFREEERQSMMPCVFGDGPGYSTCRFGVRYGLRLGTKFGRRTSDCSPLCHLDCCRCVFVSENQICFVSVAQALSLGPDAVSAGWLCFITLRYGSQL